MANQQIKRQCQHCGNFTVFEVRGEYLKKDELTNNIYYITEWSMIECMSCSEPTLEKTTKVIEEKVRAYDEEYHEWEEIIEAPETSIIYPTTNMACIPLPSLDMPKEVAEDYDEARTIFGYSPRSSAALLRLALQKLCIQLGGKGTNLNDNIGALVQKGLSTQIQQALDILRVIGNNAVHPGEIDIQQNKEITLKLFEIINFIVNQMITQPQEIAKIYDKLPEGAKQGIVKRDQKHSSTTGDKERPI